MAYNLDYGWPVGWLPLKNVMAGTWKSGRKIKGMDVSQRWVPGLALSPNGKQLAVLDGRDNKLTLIDARKLRVERTESLTRHQSLLERLGLTPAVAHAKGAGFRSSGESLSVQYSPDGRRLYVTGARREFDKQEDWSSNGLGLRVVDVSNGEIVSEKFKGRDVLWLRPTPDGKSLYVVVSKEEGKDEVHSYVSYDLYRLAPDTLKVEASRSLYYAPRMYLLPERHPTDVNNR